MKWTYAMYSIRNIRNSDIFSALFFQVYAGIFNHTQRYWGIHAYRDIIKAYSGLLRLLSPGIFRTRGFFKPLWNVDQAYSKPCHMALFNNIQAYSEPCVTLVYAETLHTWNPGIFRILHNCIQTPIQNPVILRKIYEISELWPQN